MKVDKAGPYSGQQYQIRFFFPTSRLVAMLDHRILGDLRLCNQQFVTHRTRSKAPEKTQRGGQFAIFTKNADLILAPQKTKLGCVLSFFENALMNVFSSNIYDTVNLLIDLVYFDCIPNGKDSKFSWALKWLC